VLGLEEEADAAPLGARERGGHGERGEPPRRANWRGETEIDQPDLALRPDEDVPRVDVAVDDAARVEAGGAAGDAAAAGEAAGPAAAGRGVALPQLAGRGVGVEAGAPLDGEVAAPALLAGRYEARRDVAVEMGEDRRLAIERRRRR